MSKTGEETVSNEYDVYFKMPASTIVRGVEAEDPDEAIETAYEKLPGSICHQCARKVELAGDWEPDAVFEVESGDLVWQEKC